jgi:hypothetical protein
VDQRQLAAPRPLPIERVLTILMDIAAQDAGYLSD